MTEQRAAERRESERPSSEHPGTSRPNGKRPLSPVELARRAARELSQLIGREPESIVGLERSDGGWCVELEVVDTQRVPATSDILAQYSVDVDSRGRLLGYRRTRRYTRGRTQDEL